MKAVIKIVVAVIGGAFALMLVTGLIAKAMLSEGRIKDVLGTLESRVPVPVTASGGDFDLAQWFLFRPAIGIDGLSVGNPPGYSETPLLTAGKVYAQVALLPLFSGRTEVHSIRLASPVLTVERGRGGRTNLETVLDAVSQGGGKASAETAGDGGGSELSIDSFHIDTGVIRYVDAGARQAALTIREIDLALTDFSTDSSCRFTLAAALFESGSSRLRFDGRGGPFKAESIPADGELSAEFAPADMPADMRERIFGQLLRDPGGSSRVTLNASVKGDFATAVQGAGKIALSNFQIGPDSANRLPLVGEAPLKVSLRRPLSRPAFELAIDGGSLQFGQGSWKGGAEVRYDGNRFQGGTSGAISGVRIEELLNAFTASKDKAFGRAEIPAYRLSFSGRDGDEIRNSLNGNGRVTLEEGRIAMFDMVNTIQGNLNKALGGSQPAAGDTDFARFASSVEIGGQMMRLPDLALESSQTQITGQGYITFAKELNFDLVSTIHGPLAATMSSRKDASGQPVAGVPVRVRGTIDQPQVTPDVEKMAVETIKEQATGILDQLFRKKEQSPR